MPAPTPAAKKNGSLVRSYLGYSCFDTVAQTNLLNQIYDRMWLLHNFFHPVMRQSQHRPHAYNQPRTPWERLCATSLLPADRQAALNDLCQATNPLALRNEVHSLLDRLNRLPAAKPGKPQDVRRTLFQPATPPMATPAPLTLSVEGSATAR